MAPLTNFKSHGTKENNYLYAIKSVNWQYLGNESRYRYQNGIVEFVSFLWKIWYMTRPYRPIKIDHTGQF